MGLKDEEVMQKKRWAGSVSRPRRKNKKKVARRFDSTVGAKKKKGGQKMCLDDGGKTKKGGQKV